MHILSLCAVSFQSSPLVTVNSHSAQWIETRGQVVFRFEALVNNSLETPLSGVDVGLVYASDTKDLANGEPSDFYGGDPMIRIGESTVAFRLVIAHPIAPKSSARVQWEIEPSQALRDSTIRPRAFVTHLLGYRFAEPPIDLIDTLRETDVAADEWALMESLGLMSLGRTLSEARTNWRKVDSAIKHSTKLLELPLPRAPSQSLVAQWIVRVLLLGVVGGERAVEQLRELKGRQDLKNLDEGFQVLRLARLTESHFESPMAFAFPTEITTFQDLVSYCLERAGSAREEALSPPPELARGVVELNDASEPPITENFTRMGIGLLVGFCLGVLGIVFLNSRKRLNEEQ